MSLVAMAASGLIAAGCATSLGGSQSSTSAITEMKAPSRPAQPQKPVRIAMLLPLSGYGPAAVTGKGMKQAGELALFELDNPLVQVIVKDDKNSPVGAAAAAAEALSEGAEIIVGPMTAAATTAIAPIAQKANVPILSFSNDQRVAGNGVYLMSPLPAQEIERIVSFTASQGKKRFAALIPDDEYGSTIEPAFRAAAAKSGATIALVTRYPLDPNEMLMPVRQAVEEIKMNEDGGLPVDALLLAGGPEALQHLSPLVTFSGLDLAKVKLIGTSGWDFPNAGRNAVLSGGWYPGADPHGWQDFSQRFSRSFGTAPPRLASLAYDAVSMAISLSGYEPGQRYTVANLTRPSGFQGVAGITRFSATGLPDRGLAVLELQAFGTSVVDPAPGTSTTPSAAQMSSSDGPRPN